jgi:hypothetical protein
MNPFAKKQQDTTASLMRRGMAIAKARNVAQMTVLHAKYMEYKRRTELLGVGAVMSAQASNPRIEVDEEDRALTGVATANSFWDIPEPEPTPPPPRPAVVAPPADDLALDFPLAADDDDDDDWEEWGEEEEEGEGENWEENNSSPTATDTSEDASDDDGWGDTDFWGS